jgi:hypothetical protein
MIKKVGTFQTSSDVLRISDPCYDKSIWCTGTLKNCKIGEWSGFLVYSDEGDWGERVANNIAIFGDVSEDEAQNILTSSNWKNSNISVGVDSGQCGIFDDLKYPKGDTGNYDGKGSFYDKCCNLTLGEDCGGVVLNSGVVSSSGFGDGSYDCLTSQTGGKITAVLLVFIGDDEEENEEDENDDEN